MTFAHSAIVVCRQKADKITELENWHSAGVASPVTRGKDKLRRNQELP
jgi:hypothetical protein